MDQAMLEDHLRQAEEHVELGRQHIAQQMALINRLEQDGHNTTQARELLATFEALPESHEADRDRLREELANTAGR